MNRFKYIAEQEISIWDDLVINAVEGYISTEQIIPFSEIYLFNIQSERQEPSINPFPRRYRGGKPFNVIYATPRQPDRKLARNERVCPYCGNIIRLKRGQHNRKYCNSECRKNMTKLNQRRKILGSYINHWDSRVNNPSTVRKIADYIRSYRIPFDESAEENNVKSEPNYCYYTI